MNLIAFDAAAGNVCYLYRRHFGNSLVGFAVYAKWRCQIAEALLRTVDFFA